MLVTRARDQYIVSQSVSGYQLSNLGKVNAASHETGS